MAEGSSAGAVWLDLVIKNSIGKQITKMSRQAGEQAEKTFGDAGEKAGKAFQEPFNEALENARLTVKRLENQLTEGADKLDKLYHAHTDKVQQGLASPGALEKDKAYQRMEAQQDRIYQRLLAAQDRLKVKEDADAYKKAKAAEKTAQTAEQTASREISAAKRAAAVIRQVYEHTAQRVRTAWSVSGSAIQKSQAFVASRVKRSWRKATQGVSRLLHTLARTMRRVFVLGAFLAFFHGLRDAMGAAIRQNAQLSKSLAQVKGNLYNAFSSIFSAVLPALTAMMNGLAALTNRIASFMSALFGTTYAKSQAAAKQLASVGKGAAGAGKKMQGALASWDELNVLQKNDSSGGGGIQTDVSAPADQVASSFGDALRQAIQSGDWTALGETLSSKFNGAIERMDTSAAGKKLGDRIQAIVQTAHTFIQTADWNLLGEKIASGLTNAARQVDAYQVGALLASTWTIAFGTLNGYVKNTDWGLVAQKISDGFKGALNTMYAAVSEFDWAGLGQRIFEFLSGIDWGGILASVVQLIGGMFGGALSLLWGFLKEAWNSMSGYWKSKTEEAGGDGFLGFLKGIIDGITGIADWINVNIFQPFWNGICNAFQIHSPSKKMMEIGQYIIAGVLDGILRSWTRIKEFFTTALASVQKVFSDAWQALKSNTESIWKGITDTIKAAVNSIIGVVNSMIQAVTNGINAAVDALNRIHVDFPEWVPIVGGKQFGLNIPHVTAPQIPMLANGGIIRQPTLAMMGEYQGAGANPEIAAPQSLMRETFMESITPLVDALMELVELLRDDANRDIVLQLVFSGNMAQLARVIKPYLDKEQSRRCAQLIVGGEAK